MAAPQTGGRRLIVRWTAPKGFAAIIVFFIITVLIEVMLVVSFQMLGVVDRNAWVNTFRIPYANWTFTVSISPLFHLLPLSVITVLLFSWEYLTKYSTYAPQRAEVSKRSPPPVRRPPEGSRTLKSLRQLFRRFSRRLQRIGRGVKAGAERIRGVSYLSQRLSFARAAVRSAFMIFVAFICIFFIVVLVEYPNLIHQWAVNLYRGSPSLRHFVVGIGQWAYGVGHAVPPLGAVGSAVNNAFSAAGPGFRRSLENAGASLTLAIVNADVTTKYILSQNLAAWIAAVIAMIYGAYASSRPRRRTKSR